MDGARAGNLGGHLGVGQRLYTPRQNGAEPVPGERPYAGWLFVDAGVRVAGSRVEHRVDVEAGVTGPGAFGEPVQNGFHRLIGSRLRQGWDRQLRAEVAGLVRYGIAGTHPVAGARLRPHAEIAVGTLWSGAASGLEARFGAAPGLPGLSASAGLRQEWVARNLFLDGNTFHADGRADKRGWVSQASMGIGDGFEHWSVEYHLVVRSREYTAQPGAHGYGSALLRWRQ